MFIELPALGIRMVMESNIKGHYIWLSNFGWHDCNPKEDELIHSYLYN